VVVVAAEDNQSGTGARIAFPGQLAVTRRASDVIAVAGSPAEATEFGLSVVFADRPPDLVVSGINAGQNVGAIVIHSGTVGAVVMSLTDGVPAIAISAEIDLATAAAPHGDAVASLVELIDVLAAGVGDRSLLPDGLGLNINYPYVEGGEEVGVAVARIGRGFIDVMHLGAELPETIGASSVYHVGFDLTAALNSPPVDVRQAAA
jgi:5'/3'-nucleotidase SurE